LEDLKGLLDELAACRGRGQQWAGPVDDGESGGCLDLVEHLHQGAGAAVVKDAGCCGDAVVAGTWVISSSRRSAPFRIVTARIAGEGGAGRSRWPMPLNWLWWRTGRPQFLARLIR
jgi:hypothetical protein